MLDINVTIKGDKIVLEGLGRFTRSLPGAVKKGLKEVVRGVHPEALKFLSGPGRKSNVGYRMKRTVKMQDGNFDISRSKKKIASRGQSSSLDARPGAFPVPRLTGHLARMLDFLDPGQSKSAEGHSFTAGALEAAVFDSAEYADIIHEGRGSSAKFGERPFLTDALESFNRGDKIKQIIEDKINDAMRGSGL